MTCPEHCLRDLISLTFRSDPQGRYNPTWNPPMTDRQTAVIFLTQAARGEKSPRLMCFPVDGYDLDLWLWRNSLMLRLVKTSH